MEVVWRNEQNLFPVFLAGGLLASGMPYPAAASTPPQRQDESAAHAGNKGALPEDSSSSSRKGAKDADKASSVSQQRKQSVEAIEKLLERGCSRMRPNRL